MRFTSERRIDDGVVELEFTLDDIPGILWKPASAPVPLILMGHPGDMRGMYPWLAARARGCATQGFAAVAIELPGGGERPSEEVVDRLVFPMVDRAVPEWQATLDALLALPEIDGPVGFSGGVIAIGTGWPPSSRASSPPAFSPAATCLAASSRRLAGSPFRCSSCCSGTTKATIGSWLWSCSTPSAPGRRACTPTWAGTRASRSSRGRMRPDSSLGICARSVCWQNLSRSGSGRSTRPCGKP